MGTLKPTALNPEEEESTIRADAIIFMSKVKLLQQSEVVETVEESDVSIARAICVLGNCKMLTKESYSAILDTPTDKDAVAIAHNIVDGLENLKKLEKYGMNTEENRKAVSSAGENAVQTSLKLWLEAANEIMADVRAQKGHPLTSAYSTAGSRAAARSLIEGTKKELEAVTQSLHKPEAVKAPSPKKK